MINQIFNNFYTDSEQKQLSEYINNVVHKSHNFAMEKELGRYYGVIQDKLMSYSCIGNFPENLLEKTKLFAEDHFGIDQMHIFDIIIIRYCTKNGLVPKLSYHKDGGALTKYTVDYQHDANIVWPVLVEDKEFVLENNSIVTFIGTDQMHGRPEKVFSKDDYVENIFFQFTEKRK